MLGRLSWMIALSFPLALVACRREPSPPEAKTEAKPVASSRPEANACPPVPAWAGEFPTGAIVEVLHVPNQAKSDAGDGTGYRLFEDGRLDTYSVLEFFTNDAGTLESRRVPGTWSTPGGVSGEKLEATRKLVLDTKREELEKWAPKRKPKDAGADFTLIRANYEGTVVQTCYFGDHAPPPLGAIERAMHDLRGGIKTQK